MKTMKMMLAGLFIFTLSLGVFAQGPPNPPDTHGTNDNEPPGGDAPLTGELILFSIVGLAYTGIKIYKTKKTKALEQLH